MKRIKYLVVLFIVLIITVGCFNQNNKPEVITTKTSISGVIKDITIDSLTVEKNEKDYTFDLEQFKDKNNLELFIGDEINIDFNGTVYSNKDFQDEAEINDIKVEKYAPLELDSSWELDGVFSEYYTLAYRKLLTMTTEEKIGQVLFSRVPQEKQIETVTNYHLGGYILFGRDFKGQTKEAVVETISSYQNNSNIPLIIAVDEEGGDVVRVSSNPNLRSKRFKSSQELYSAGGFDAIKEDTISKSTLLSSLGINMNLSPLADVSTSKDDYIYDRSFGHDANLTSTYIKTVIDASKNGKVTFTLKHFPGYGNNADTHTGIAIDNRSLESFKTNDFLPFQAGIDEGALAILVSHNIMTSVDSNKPASLSKPVHDVLKNDLKFTGMIMTDDLEMGAIKKYTSASPEVDALNAGNHLLIITNFESATENIKKALENNTLSMDTLNKASLKVLAYKYYVGLLS